jgi:hypothetical protein
MDLKFVDYLKRKAQRQKRIDRQFKKDREQHRKEYLAGDSAFYRRNRDRRKEVKTALEMVVVGTLISALLYAMLSL